MIDKAFAILLGQRSGVGTAHITPSTEVVDLSKCDLPRVVYSRLPSPRGYTDDGANGVRAGRFQLDVFGATLQSDVMPIIERLRKSATAPSAPGLDNYAGTIDGTVFLWIHFPAEHQYQPMPVLEGRNRAIVRVSQDINISFREAI